MSEIRRIAVSHSLRRRSTLPRIDYSDAFVVGTGSSGGMTGEGWARAMLEAAPEGTRRALRCGWTALGLELGPPRDPSLVLGWQIVRRTPDWVVLGSGSRFGLAGEVLFERQPSSLLFATFVRLDGLVARLGWAVVAPRHRRVVRSLLEAGVRRERQRR